MKKLIQVGIAAVLFTSLSTQTLRAVAFTFDEYGNGYEISGVAGTLFTNPVPGSLMPDPSSGITGSLVLVYTLPFTVTNGDVAIVDANNGNTISHLVRFYSDDFFFNDYAIFYAQDGTHSPADVGIPASSNPVQIMNQGPSGTFWAPTANQPGFLNRYSPVGDPGGYTFYAPSTISPGGSTNVLTITRSPPNVIVSWPTNAATITLLRNGNLYSTNWVQVTNQVNSVNGSNQVVFPTSQSAVQFFRLKVSQ
jgi:hypothetical protein